MAAAAPMKLYTNPRSRGMLVQWYLRELGVGSDKVELINVSLENKEHKADDYLKLHPFGRIPALVVDGDLTLMESGAILLFLGERFGGLDTPEKRAKAAQWVLFANATLPDTVFSPKRDEWMPEVLSKLDKMLSEHKFIQGAEFSVADVALGATLWWMPSVVPEFKLEPYTHVSSYVDRMKARPAFEDDSSKPQSH